MYLWGAHTLTAVVHLCINISLCLCDTVRRQQVCAVQHNRHAECREWWASLQRTSDTPMCVVLHVKMRQLRGSLPLYASVPNAVLCILYGNIHENIRFLIMDTLTALAFTVFFTYSEVLSKLTASTELLFRLSNIIHSNCQVHFCCSQNARISVHGLIFCIAWPIDRTTCRTSVALTSIPFFPSVSLM